MPTDSSRSSSILLVEDNPGDVELALYAFEKSNIANHVEVARDGAEALEYLAKCKEDGEDCLPNLILLDLKLPKVDGIDVLRTIKGDPRLKLVPVVVLTSSHEESDVVSTYGLGTNSYIVKPVDFEQFTQVVRQLSFYWLLLNHPPVVPAQS